MADFHSFFAGIRKKLVREAEETTALSPEVRAPQGKQPLFSRHRPKQPFALAVLFTTLKLLVFAFVVICFAGLGIAFGIGKAYIETAPEIDVAQLTISDRTSFLYDKNGKLITSIADVEYRDWTDIEDIPDMLKNAFIAVEDVRFYKHSGVDFKRLFSAALEILGNTNSSGGSTITQQLIKNKILGTQRNYKRKIQEAYLALQLEKMVSKDDILEAYLNDIYLGESNYGVKTAAMDYFGKELSELTIRECAMLAGLTQSPYNYNPRRNMYVRDMMEITDNRTNQVLARMYQAGYISGEQYQAALVEQVNILEQSEQKQMYDMAYFVEYAIYDVITHLLEQRGLPNTQENRDAVENELRTGGYHIYTTVDPDIQNTVQETLATWDGYPTLADSSKGVVEETMANGAVITTVQPQAAAVVIDYHTGELRAVVGGREEPQIRRGLNRAYQSYTEVGSAIKPLSVYGPALDLGVSPATIVPNMDGRIEGWDTQTGYPSGGLKTRYGPVTVRRGVMSSLNVVAARVLMQYVGVDVAADYLLKLGATESKINRDGFGPRAGHLRPDAHPDGGGVRRHRLRRRLPRAALVHQGDRFGGQRAARCGRGARYAPRVPGVHRLPAGRYAHRRRPLRHRHARAHRRHDRRGQDGHQLRLCERVFCRRYPLLRGHRLGRARLPGQQAQGGRRRRHLCGPRSGRRSWRRSTSRSRIGTSSRPIPRRSGLSSAPSAPFRGCWPRRRATTTRTISP